MKQDVIAHMVETLADDLHKAKIGVLSDEEVLSIMKAGQTLLRHDEQTSDLMTDEAFLDEFHAIIPPGVGVVDTQQAADIYNLRVRYQRLPRRYRRDKEKGRIELHYSDNSVRLQVHGDTLKPLDEEQSLAIFGTTFGRSHRFLLRDVLTIELGRWPNEPVPQPKLPRGRPRLSSAERAEQEEISHREERVLAMIKQAKGA